MKTTIHNKYKEQYDVYIGRPSIYGNPFQIGKDGDRQQVVEKYKNYFYLFIAHILTSLLSPLSNSLRQLKHLPVHLNMPSWR